MTFPGLSSLTSAGARMARKAVSARLLSSAHPNSSSRCGRRGWLPARAWMPAMRGPRGRHMKQIRSVRLSERPRARRGRSGRMRAEPGRSRTSYETRRDEGQRSDGHEGQTGQSRLTRRCKIDRYCWSVRPQTTSAFRSGPAMSSVATDTKHHAHSVATESEDSWMIRSRISAGKDLASEKERVLMAVQVGCV